MQHQGLLEFIVPDGNYDMSEMAKYLSTTDFTCEKDLCDYIENHIEDFSRDCLGVEYRSHFREYAVDSDKRTRGNKRIDFMIITKDGQRIGLECKCPKYGSELSYAIGQALVYLFLFERNYKKMDQIFIVTTKLDWPLPFVIDKYNLPVGLIGFDKQKFVTFQHGSTIGK